MVASLTPVPEGAVPPEPVNILLVDDQPGRLLTYRAILEPLGERLVEASSGMDALKRLMEEEFALILLDVNMPGMDGFETASMIHQHPRYEKTPIIFVTAVNVTDMDRLKGYKLGAVDYVMVPVIPEILRSKVVVLVELFRKRRELQSANERLAAANEALQLEKAQELERLNESLREANTELATRNRELQIEIGERARVERQLIAADLRKDEFLATLAHELRNPLAPLRNALHIRRLSARDDAGDDPLQRTMERQLGLLVRLIDDLLDVARITRGKLALRPRETTLRRVLEAAVETATPVIEAGGHELSVELPDHDVPMLVDDERLSQVFANLLNNAAKYSDARGRIELHARADAREACVAVRDSGIGLTGDQIANIFELFSQVDTAIERARGGLGIGLTLVQQLTEMHGGRVEVHSDGLGRGSEFRVCLPLRVPGATTPRADSASREQAPGCARTRCRALVVDDNRDSADTLAMMIELLGHEVRRAYDPQEVEALVAEYHPELVFLDVGMPGLSGYDLARVLRAREGGDRMMLVAVTGWGQPEDRRRTREAGFDRHLVKPVELDEIRAICLDPARPQAPA